MDLSAGGETLSEVASARAASDSWLPEHPDDGKVRLARERLRQEDSAEDLDLEEGNPT